MVGIPSSSRLQEVRDLVVESLRLLDEEHVSRIPHDDLTCPGDRRADLPCVYRAADEVVLSGDDQRRRFNARQPVAQVERVEDLAVEEQERVGVDGLSAERVGVTGFCLAVAREVKRKLTKENVRELLVGGELALLLLVEGCDRIRIPRLSRPLLDPYAHRHLLLGCEAGQRGREEKAGDAVRMRRGVCLRDDAPMRVAEEQQLLLTKMPAQLLHVGDVIVELIRPRILRPLRAACASWVEHYE